jgi:hypothetical protein
MFRKSVVALGDAVGAAVGVLAVTSVIVVSNFVAPGLPNNASISAWVKAGGA